MSFHLRAVSFRYPSAAPGELSLRDVTADLPDGEVVAVLGPSGCGKTTLLNLLSLLWDQDIDRGEIEYRDGCGKVEYRALLRDPGRRDRLRREQFGVVLQNCYLLPHFSCLHNVGMQLALLGWEEREQRAWAEALIRAVDGREEPRDGEPRNGLWAARTNMPREVSLGQRQRMAVLRAVAHNPRVVFADEPVSNLDRTSTQAVLQLLLDWKRGRLHDGCAAALRKAAGGTPAALQLRLQHWEKSETVPRTLFLVCHHLDIARKHADRALLFDADHRLVGTFTRDRWAELDAELDRVMKLAPVEDGRR